MENCPSQRFSYSRGLGSSISQTVNKILGLRIAKSQLTQNRSVQSLSSDKNNKHCFSDEYCLEGNTKDIPSSLDRAGNTEKPDHDVEEYPSPIYKIALSACATKAERKAFNTYQDTAKQTGWAVFPIPVSRGEESAFVVVPANEKGQARAAAYVTDLMLDKVLRRASCEWR